MDGDGIDARWQQLNPIFVRGMQRSGGTSMMARVLREMGIVGFGEGHLWFELVRPFEQLRDPDYRPHLRDDSYALGMGRISQLEKYVAVALDQFHRDHLAADSRRWMDKSPGAEAVRVTPLLAELFPRAQFVFMYRNGIATVHSAITKWPDYPDIFRVMCRAWAETMAAWRAVRMLLGRRYIEIAQEDMAAKSLETAICLTDFLGAREYRERVVELFQSKRVLSAFPDRAPGDYRYQIDWTPDQQAYFIETCQGEMKIWGYPVDFDRPATGRDGPEMRDDSAGILEAFYRREARITELERRCATLGEHLNRVEQGRVMRLMTGLQRLLGGLGDPD